MDARWFSVVLNRRNAPWAYLKGEPFRNIASLGLVGLVAVMLFGDRVAKQMHRKPKRLTLTPSTDNLGNTFVYICIESFYEPQVSFVHSGNGVGSSVEEERNRNGLRVDTQRTECGS